MKLTTAGGQEFILGNQAIDLAPEQVGGRIRYAGSDIILPSSASLHWPALPHNPYVKDGHAKPDEARIELRLPFDGLHTEHRLTIRVGGHG